MTYVIGVDLGGTKTAAGVVAADGSVLMTAQTPTLNRDGGEAILDATAALVSGLRQQAGAAGLEISAAGVGSAGVIDADRGTVVSATDAILGWAGTLIASGLEKRLNFPAGAVKVINDVHAHAMGEAWLGAGAGSSSMLMMAFGTGVGGSFVVHGHPLPGYRFVGGHVGHIASSYAVAPDGSALACTCGSRGHVEAIASGPALHALYLRSGGDPGATDARAVFARAGTGDPVALAAVSTVAKAAGQAVGGLANVLDPEVVVVSGGLADAGPLWWNTMTDEASGQLMPPLAGLRIVRARLGNSAAIVGAAALVL